MKPARLLLLSLLATGCASAPSATAPARTLRSYEPVAAPSIQPEPADAAEPEALPAGRGPAPFDEATVFRLTALPADADTAALAQEAAASSSAAMPANRHSFSGGLGIRFRDGESALDLLAQYHYYVNPKIDIGAIADWALSPIDSLLIAPAAWWHPNDRLTLFGAPGFEIQSGDGVEFAMRLGGSYRLMLEKLAIRPFGWYDFVTDRDDSFAIGIAVGI
jgi:hypothetical protein